MAFKINFTTFTYKSSKMISFIRDNILNLTSNDNSDIDFTKKEILKNEKIKNKFDNSNKENKIYYYDSDNFSDYKNHKTCICCGKKIKNNIFISNIEYNELCYDCSRNLDYEYTKFGKLLKNQEKLKNKFTK